MTRTFASLAVFALAAGCGDAPLDPPVQPGDCSAPNRLVGGQCLETGVADDGCVAGTLGQADGSCHPAGMLPAECARGFEHDGDVRCLPILPAAPCASGAIAIPGDTVCRPIGSCGNGTWGDIAHDDNTVFVDASFVGASTGTINAPWATLSEAVTAAPSGSLLAVAAGSYLEDVVIENKALQIRGVCPQNVELVGAGVEIAALSILGGASGSEVSGIAITGPGIGVVVTGSENVVFSRVYIHGAKGRGLNVEDTFGPTSVTLGDSLLEANGGLATFAGGGQLVIQDSAIRATTLQGSFGRGVSAESNPVSGSSATMTLRGSVIEANHEIGVYSAGADLSVEGSVVRGTLGGRGIVAQSADGDGSSLSVAGSLIDDNRDDGIYVSGSQASIATSVVRATRMDANGERGRGISVQASTSGGVASLANVRHVVVEANHELGIFVSGSEAHIETTVVRDMLANDAGRGGNAVQIQYDVMTGAPSLGTLRGCLIERNPEVGVLFEGSDGQVEASLIRDHFPNADGFGGRGIGLQPNPVNLFPSSAVVSTSRIERNQEFGVSVASSSLNLADSVIAETKPSNEDYFGDGVVVNAIDAPSSAELHEVLIADVTRAGLLSFAATVTLDKVAIRCAPIDLQGEPFEGTEANYQDRGSNGCGCPTVDRDCKLTSTGLDPPYPLDPP